MSLMAVIDKFKCQCAVPKPGSFSDVFGARKCQTCGLIANWRELEPEESPVQGS